MAADIRFPESSHEPSGGFEQEIRIASNLLRLSGVNYHNGQPVESGVVRTLTVRGQPMYLQEEMRSPYIGVPERRIRILDGNVPDCVLLADAGMAIESRFVMVDEHRQIIRPHTEETFINPHQRGRVAAKLRMVLQSGLEYGFMVPGGRPVRNRGQIAAKVLGLGSGYTPAPAKVARAVRRALDYL